MAIKINTADIKEAAKTLKAGDAIELTGTIYTSRDAAHKRIMAALDKGEETPYPIDGSIIYYAGPTEAKPGEVVGSCGPTTSSRMDPFSPRILDLGLGAMIGKGERNQATVDAIIRNGSVYFCAIGGAAAVVAEAVKELEVVAYHDLGCESVKKFTVKDMPLICAIDCHGGNIFRDGKAKYKKEIVK